MTSPQGMSDQWSPGVGGTAFLPVHPPVSRSTTVPDKHVHRLPTRVTIEIIEDDDRYHVRCKFYDSQLV